MGAIVRRSTLTTLSLSDRLQGERNVFQHLVQTDGKLTLCSNEKNLELPSSVWYGSSQGAECPSIRDALVYYRGVYEPTEVNLDRKRTGRFTVSTVAPAVKHMRSKLHPIICAPMCRSSSCCLSFLVYPAMYGMGM